MPALCALGAAAALVFLMSATSGLTVFADEWNVILRPDWSPDSLLAPLNEHIYLGPVIVYKTLLALFGLDSTAPFRFANICLLLAVAGLTYALVARRLGAALAALLAAVLVLLGPAWEDLLWPAGISFMGAMAAGLGAFLVLERRPRHADALTCGLLVISLSFSTLGLAFTVGAAVDVLLRPGRRLARAFIPAVPVALYLLWYLAYGRDIDSPASLDNLAGMPQYVWNAAAASIASLTGLSGIDERSLGSSSSNGQPLLIVGLIAAIWAIARNRSLLSRELWVFGATALFFWASAGINEIPGREPGASRYQLIGGVLVILIASELLRGTRLSQPWLALAGVLAAAAIVSNLGALREGEDFLREHSDRNSAALAALDGARARVSGDTALAGLPASPFTAKAQAGQYFAAVDRWGAPIGDPADALAGPQPARKAADRFLAAVLGIGLEPLGDADGGGRNCTELSGREGAIRGIELPAGGVELHSDEALDAVSLVRWSGPGFPTVDLGGAPAGATRLAIPADDYAQPWFVQVATAGAVQACPLGG